METNQLLPVSSLTRRLNSRKALSDQRILVPLKVKPRKLIWSVARHLALVLVDRELEFACQEAF